jgi:hypothetical protein
MVGTPEPLTPVEDRVLQEPYLKNICEKMGTAIPFDRGE